MHLKIYMYNFLHWTHLPWQHSPAVLEDFQDIVPKGVPVLVQESIGVVEHLPSIVPDTKLGIVHLWFDVEGISVVSAVQFLKEALVCAFWKSTLLVQEIKDTKFLQRNVSQLMSPSHQRIII